MIEQFPKTIFVRGFRVDFALLGVRIYAPNPELRLLILNYLIDEGLMPTISTHYFNEPPNQS